MSTVVNTNRACCSIPPVKSDYSPIGKFKSFAGFDKVYFTGEGNDIVIVSVYDIFGFKPQTEQGADMLAKCLGATVVMPDFFEPNEPMDPDNFPPKTDEEKDALQKFFAGPANPGKSVKRLLEVGRLLKEDGAKFVGAYGMCWGGKVTILAGSQDGTPFDAVSAVHPAMLSASDTENLQVPLGLFISKDEPRAEYEKMVEIISKKNFAGLNRYKVYQNMFHGWAAARANLDDEENRKAFNDLYQTLCEFLQNVHGKDGNTPTSRF